MQHAVETPNFPLQDTTRNVSCETRRKLALIGSPSRAYAAILFSHYGCHGFPTRNYEVDYTDPEYDIRGIKYTVLKRENTDMPNPAKCVITEIPGMV